MLRSARGCGETLNQHSRRASGGRRRERTRERERLKVCGMVRVHLEGRDASRQKRSSRRGVKEVVEARLVE